MVRHDDGVAEVAGMTLGGCPGLFALARHAMPDTLFTTLMFGGAAFLAAPDAAARPVRALTEAR